MKTTRLITALFATLAAASFSSCVSVEDRQPDALQTTTTTREASHVDTGVGVRGTTSTSQTTTTDPIY